MGVVTVYGLLEERFGPRTRRSAALCFALGRILASGVRLFIAALAFGAATGLGIEPAIVLCGAVAGFYTLAGGIRSVVWTDLLQAALFILGALCMAGVIIAASDGGLSEIWSWAREGQRARIFHWRPFFSLSDPRPFGVALVGAFFLTLATHATDHDMVQRLLTTRTGRQGGLALLWSGLLNFPLTLLFLFIGTGLAFFYAGAPGGGPADPAQVVPVFALDHLSSGLRGLVFAALFAAAMSSLDSAICAIATTWVIDVAPSRRGDEAGLVRRIRIASALFCGLLVAAALGMAAYHRALAPGSGDTPTLSLVELALSSMTILYGGLLGIFGTGLVSRRRRRDRAGLAGLAAGALVGLALFLHPLALGDTWIAWPWWIPIGAGVSVCAAWVADR
jgi:Na+/proline symporter